MEQFSTELLTLVIGILSLLTSITIAFILHNASKKIETQNFSNSLRASWIDIDSTVLADDRLLEAIDDLLHPGYKGSPIEEKRRRWLCYMISNALSVNFNGIKHRLLPDPKAAEQSLIASLEGLTQHPEFMDIIVNYSYEQDFKDLCLRVREKHVT